MVLSGTIFFFIIFTCIKIRFMRFPFFIFALLLFLAHSCNKDNPVEKPLFKALPSSQTNITFSNSLTETDSFNYFLFSYIYMGGGISAGDFNNDGLCDLYFTANMESNRLYLNRGDLSFEDVTTASETGGDQRWMLGSTLCDINDDGLLDIYVSVSGLLGNTQNLLYVNRGLNADGIPEFSEEAGKYGIDDEGLSTQGTFFDYDNDGDQDLYVANYPITQFNSPPFFYRQMMRNVQMENSDHLYRNNGDGSFTDVTREAGLLSFGLSLSATISDLDQDGYPDIYVSNDFTSPDYFFFNNGDGTFTDRSLEVTGHTSFYGMGADIADYNNDGWQDIIQIDMAPEDNQRAKENMSAMDPRDFREMVNQGLHHQYKYSTLYLNHGTVNKGLSYFSETAWMAGVTSTDWSWAALFADFDLDGWKDLYITNGSRRDINNIDYFNQMQESVYFNQGLAESDFLDQIENMPLKALPNYMYRNNKNLTFSRVNEAWNMPEESYSNGVVYADLDNDGDLEIVVNNIDQEALIYRNYAVENGDASFLKVDFRGSPGNLMGIGSTVSIWLGEKMQVAELTLSRGYESSMEPILYFGLGKEKIIDSLLVKWNDGQVQVLKNIQANQKLTLSYLDASPPLPVVKTDQALFEEISDSLGINFVHQENIYDDLDKQILIPHMMSQLGSGISTGDVNGDLREDFFTGNAYGGRGAMFVQTVNGDFSAQRGPWEEDRIFEDAGSLLFDADGDGDLDLYVVSGGNEFPLDSPHYMDRLYLNNGKGNFTRTLHALPEISSSGSCVQSIDFDKDGDLDLFVGGRHVPGKYPYPANSQILENLSTNSRVLFEDVTDRVAPGLLEVGMVTDVFCTDLDNNGWEDLVVVGEWMPVCILRNMEGKFEHSSIEGSSAWWFCVEGADFDQDGDMDLVAGNLGLNIRYRADPGSTFDVYADDFDRDGKSDIVLTYLQDGKRYPLRGKSCFVSQNPGIDLKFPTYEAFGKATVSDIYTKKALKSSLHLQAESFASSYLENDGTGNFTLRKLPNEAQLSSINDMLIEDFDGDGKLDILAAGNLYPVEIVTPRNDGGCGVFLKGNGSGGFEYLPVRNSGFFAPGEVKSLARVIPGEQTAGEKATGGLILVGNNDDKLQVFKHRK